MKENLIASDELHRNLALCLHLLIYCHSNGNTLIYPKSSSRRLKPKVKNVILRLLFSLPWIDVFMLSYSNFKLLLNWQAVDSPSLRSTPKINYRFPCCPRSCISLWKSMTWGQCYNVRNVAEKGLAQGGCHAHVHFKLFWRHAPHCI